MIISSLLFRQYTFRSKLLVRLGFPMKPGSLCCYQIDGQDVSQHTDTTLDKFRVSLPNHGDLVFFRKLPDEIMFAMLLVISSLGLFAAVSATTGSWIIALLVNWIAWEVWSLFNIQILVSFLQYKGNAYAAKLSEIIESERTDRELCKQTKIRVRTFTDELSNHDSTIADQETIQVPSGGNLWVPVRVNLVPSDVHPTALNASVVFAGAMSDESCVCVFPSFETIESWLDDELQGMRRLVQFDTHTWNYLSSLKAKKILSSFKRTKHAVTQTLGNLATASKLDIKDRPRVIITGQPEDEGQILVQGLRVIASDKSEETVITDVQPVLELKRAVETLIGSENKPSLQAA